MNRKRVQNTWASGPQPSKMAKNTGGSFRRNQELENDQRFQGGSGHNSYQNSYNNFGSGQGSSNANHGFGRWNESGGNEHGNQGNSYGNQGTDYNSQGNYHEHQGNNYGSQGNHYGSQGNNYSSQGNNYSSQGNNYGSQGNNYGNQGNNYGNQGNNYGNTGNYYENHGNNYGNQGHNYGNQGNNYWNHGNSYGNQENNYGNQGNSYRNEGNKYGKQGNSGENQDNSYGNQRNDYGKQGNSFKGQGKGRNKTENTQQQQQNNVGGFSKNNLAGQNDSGWGNYGSNWGQQNSTGGQNQSWGSAYQQSHSYGQYGGGNFDPNEQSNNENDTRLSNKKSTLNNTGGATKNQTKKSTAKKQDPKRNSKHADLSSHLANQGTLGYKNPYAGYDIGIPEVEPPRPTSKPQKSSNQGQSQKTGWGFGGKPATGFDRPSGFDRLRPPVVDYEYDQFLDFRGAQGMANYHGNDYGSFGNWHAPSDRDLRGKTIKKTEGVVKKKKLCIHTLANIPSYTIKLREDYLAKVRKWLAEEEKSPSGESDTAKGDTSKDAKQTEDKAKKDTTKTSPSPSAKKKARTSTDKLNVALNKNGKATVIIVKDVTEVANKDIAPYFEGKPVPVAGFIAEIRAYDISLGMGYHVAKTQIKEMVASVALKNIMNENCKVTAIDRKLGDKTYKDLVLSAKVGDNKLEMAAFLNAPDGTPEHEKRMKEKQEAANLKKAQAKSADKGNTATTNPTATTTNNTKTTATKSKMIITMPDKKKTQPVKAESESKEKQPLMDMETCGDPLQFLNSEDLSPSDLAKPGSFFSPELMEYKQKTIEFFAEQVEKSKTTLNNPVARLNRVGMLLQDTPKYLQVEVNKIKYTDLPESYKKNEKHTGEGCLVELRIQDMFIAMEYGRNKFTAKNKVAAVAEEILCTKEPLTVVARVRECPSKGDKRFPELVITSGERTRELPKYFCLEDGGDLDQAKSIKPEKLKNVHTASEISSSQLDIVKTKVKNIQTVLKEMKDKSGQMNKKMKNVELLHFAIRQGARQHFRAIIKPISDFKKSDVESLFPTGPIPSAGFLCEIRTNQFLSLGVGYHVTKSQVREHVISSVISQLSQDSDLTVSVIDRKWAEKSYKDLLLTSDNEKEIKYPPFFELPEGLKQSESSTSVKEEIKKDAEVKPENSTKTENTPSKTVPASLKMEVNTEIKEETSMASLAAQANEEMFEVNSTLEVKSEVFKSSLEVKSEVTEKTSSVNPAKMSVYEKYKHSFINFTKADGKEYSSVMESTVEKEEKVEAEEVFNPADHFNPGLIEYKRRFLEHVANIVKDKKAECKGNLELLSRAAQSCQSNPKFLYTDLSRVDKSNYPDFLQGRANTLPATNPGFICELRLQDMFLAMSHSISKAGVKDKVAQAGVAVLLGKQLHVVPMARKWHGKPCPELVVANYPGGPPYNLPVFYSAPGGAAENTDEGFSRGGGASGASGRKLPPEKMTAKEALFNHENYSHVGPLKCDIPVENFTIVLDSDNPVCVLNTSAQFSKMAVDFYYEKVNKDDFMITLFVEGVPIADARGKKKFLKQKVSVQALQCLNQFCHVVLTNKDLINACQIVRRSDVKDMADPGQTPQGRRLPPGYSAGPAAKSKEAKGSVGGVGETMLKMMGWRDGGAIGNRFKKKNEVITTFNDSIHREGLGSTTTINSNNITREDADKILSKYASSKQTDELVFSSELTFDERLEIRRLAKRYNLVERLETVKEQRNGFKRVFLIISKKLDSNFIIDKLKAGGTYGKYELVSPGGQVDKDDIIKKYLTLQKFRKEQGFPKEIDQLIQRQKEEEGESRFSWKAKGKDRISYFNESKTTRFDQSGRFSVVEDSVVKRLSSRGFTAKEPVKPSTDNWVKSKMAPSQPDPMPPVEIGQDQAKKPKLPNPVETTNDDSMNQDNYDANAWRMKMVNQDFGSGSSNQDWPQNAQNSKGTWNNQDSQSAFGSTWNSQGAYDQYSDGQYNDWGAHGGNNSWGNQGSDWGNSWGNQGNGSRDSWDNQGNGRNTRWDNNGGNNSWGYNGNEVNNSWGNGGNDGNNSWGIDGSNSWGKNGNYGNNSWGNDGNGGNDSWGTWNLSQEGNEDRGSRAEIAPPMSYARKGGGGGGRNRWN